MKKSKAIQYVGIDVHQATLVMEFMDQSGRTLQKMTVPTERNAVVQALRPGAARFHVAFEEGTQAQWLYDLVSPLVERVLVCNPRESRTGSQKSDGIDAHLLAEGLRLNGLKGVYHENAGVRVLKELVRAYETAVDLGTRCKNQLKALFRGQAIPTPGKSVYEEEGGKEKIELLPNAGAKFRARMLLDEIIKITELRDQALEEMIKEAKKHPAYKILIELPFFGPVRTAQLIAIIVTPHRFRGKRPFWTMIGLAVVTHSSADEKIVNGKLVKSKRRPMTRGLNRNHNPVLKKVFMAAAQDASRRKGPIKDFYLAMIARGMAPEMAVVTVARKIASYTLRLWKTGGKFNAAQLTMQAK